MDYYALQEVVQQLDMEIAVLDSLVKAPLLIVTVTVSAVVFKTAAMILMTPALIQQVNIHPMVQ